LAFGKAEKIWVHVAILVVCVLENTTWKRQFFTIDADVKRYQRRFKEQKK
jgi:hypothetical protein